MSRFHKLKYCPGVLKNMSVTIKQPCSEQLVSMCVSERAATIFQVAQVIQFKKFLEAKLPRSLVKFLCCALDVQGSDCFTRTVVQEAHYWRTILNSWHDSGESK